MSDSTDISLPKKKKPFLISVILLGIRSRLGAVACQWMCVAMAGFFAAMKFWFGLALLIGALGYWLAIRWMDKNDAWAKK